MNNLMGSNNPTFLEILMRYIKKESFKRSFEVVPIAPLFHPIELLLLFVVLHKVNTRVVLILKNTPNLSCCRLYYIFIIYFFLYFIIILLQQP